MCWLLIGLLFFSITIYVAKHTYELGYYGKESKQPLKIWQVILYFIISMIPWFNICAFIAGSIIYIANILDEDIVFKFKPNSESFMKKIFNWLNKDICQ